MDDLDQEIRFKSTLLKKVPADKRFNKMPSPLNVDTYDDVTDDGDDAGDVIGNGVFVDKVADDTIDDGRFTDIWRQNPRHDVAESIKKVLKVDDFFDFDKIFNDKNDNNDDNIENDESIDNNENVSDKFLDLSEPLIEVLP